MEHDSTTCPYCGDFRAGRPLVPPTSAFEVHLVAKIAELESRIQQQEWNHTRLGPRQEESNVPDPQVVETLKRLGLKEPECSLCFDEEGSYACTRPAHQTEKRDEFLRGIVTRMKSHFRTPPSNAVVNEDFAYREHIVCDQGCGGAYCSNCSANVTDEYDTCPKCKLLLVEGGMYVQGGGSDF